MNIKEYKVSIPTILYSVKKSGESEIFDIPNIYLGKTEDEIKIMNETSAAELIEMKYARMNFSGKESINADYLECIRCCAKSRDITSIDVKKPNANQKHITIYHVEKRDEIIVCEYSSDSHAKCLIRKCSPKNFFDLLEEELALFEGNKFLEKSYVVDSDILINCNQEDMKAKGIDQNTFNLLSGSTRGEKTFWVAKRMIFEKVVDCFSFISGKEGTLLMSVEYPIGNNNHIGTENVVFKPINKPDVLDKIRYIIMPRIN